MNIKDRILSRWGKVILLILVLGACASCREHHYGLSERTWTEDVLLEDGSTIVVQRFVRFNETNSLSGDAYSSVEKDATLGFTGDLASLPIWREALIPLLLYRDMATSEWVIVATTSSCDIWSDRHEPQVVWLTDKPYTMYWEFRLDEKGWREVSLSQSSIGRPVNLLHRYERDLGPGTPHVTVELRRKRESSPGIEKRYVSIVERPQVNCLHSIRERKRREAMEAAQGREANEEGASK